MTLQERLSTDLKEAMKSGDKVRVGTLRLIRSEIKNAEIAAGKSLDETGVNEVLSREAKKHRESIAEFARANRADSVQQEEAELAIVLEYLPQQMSEDDITELVKNVVSEVGAQHPKDKGKVMPVLMPQVKGKADGKLVNEIVTRILDSM